VAHPTLIEQMLAPVGGGTTPRSRMGVVVGAGVLAVAVGGGIGLATGSLVAGLSAYVAVLLGIVAFLAIRAAQAFREHAISPTAPVAPAATVPALRFGEPRVVEGVGVRDVQGAWIEQATFVVVPVANDPGAADAEIVHATIQVESLDGTRLVPETRARWQSTEQSSLPAELTIPANARANNIETVMCFDGTGSTYIWTDESRATADPASGPRLAGRFRVEPDEFLVWVAVQGSNAPRAATVIRVQRDGSDLRVVPLA
jgi:hypothetical protein